MTAETVERTAGRRLILLVANLAAWGVWQATQLDLVRRLIEAPALVAPVAIVVWIATLALLLRRPATALRAQLDDELARHNRREAFQFGFWVMLAAAAVLLAVTAFAELSASDAARLVLMAGVAAPLARLVLLERVGAGEE